MLKTEYSMILARTLYAGFLLAANSLSTESFPAPNNEISLCSMVGPELDLNATEPIVIRDITCVDLHGISYTDIIPHPNDCSLFYSCTYSGHPALPPTIPILFECGSDDTYFDMDSCACQLLGQTCCFDQRDSAHQASRLKCANPISGAGLVAFELDKINFN